jgi:hypothetical protein
MFVAIFGHALLVIVLVLYNQRKIKQKLIKALSTRMLAKKQTVFPLA